MTSQKSLRPATQALSCALSDRFPISLKPDPVESDRSDMRLLAPIRALFSSRPRLVQTGTPAASTRHIEDALERALEEGSLDYADALVRTAERAGPRSGRLTEQLARLQLAHGDAETALRVIETAGPRTAALRQLRSACLILTEQREGAHADLHSWSQRASAPLDARLLLALLEWDAGDSETARRILLRNLNQLEDPDSLALLLAFASEEERDDEARKWADRLLAATRFGPAAESARLLAGMLGVGLAVEVEAEPTDAQVAVLANELIAAEEVIPALVAAQERSLDGATARLLLRAVESALDELERPAIACEALSRLSWELDGPEAAARWIERGLRHAPMSSSLRALEMEVKPNARPPVVPHPPRQARGHSSEERAA